MVSYERYLQLPVQSSNMIIILDHCKQKSSPAQPLGKNKKETPSHASWHAQTRTKLPFLEPNAKPEHSFSALVILSQD